MRNKKQIIKNKTHLYRSLSILPVVCLVLLSNAPSTEAMNNESYSLEPQDIGLPLEKAIIEQELKQKTPRAPFEQPTGENTTISSPESKPFSFTISDEFITFGILSATNPVIRTNVLSIISPIGYQIISVSDHPMQNETKTIIPDTTCDNGQCSERTAEVWTNTLTYGFGYRCENITNSSCNTDFKQADAYKQFPSHTNKKMPQTIMQNSVGTSLSESTIRYKINISGTQPDGGYTNTITYIAVPHY